MSEMSTNKKNTIVPLIFGIIGIILSEIPIIGIILGVIGMILAKQNKKKERISKIAFILCLISLILSLIIFTLVLFIRGYNI